MQCVPQMNTPRVAQQLGTSSQHSAEIPLPFQETLLPTTKHPGPAAQWVQNPPGGCHLDRTSHGPKDRHVTFTLPASCGDLALYREQLQC